MSDFRYLPMGAPYPLQATANTLSAFTMLNNNDQVEVVFQVPDNHGARTMVITQVGYRSAAVGTGAPLFRMELQSVDTSGNPSGTAVGGGSPAQTADFAIGASNTWNWVALSNSYTANCGDFLALVFKYRSGTINGQQVGTVYGNGAAGGVLPYSIGNSAGSRTRNLGLPTYGIGTASFKFGVPIMAITAATYSTTVEKGMAFTFPASHVQSYKVAGARFQVSMPAAGKSIVMGLYSGTTLIQSATWDTDFARENANNRQVVLWFTDATLTSLAGGAEYIISLAPQDAGNNIGIQTLDVAAAGDMDAFPGGQAWYHVTRLTGGATAWTNVLTSRPSIELFVTDWVTPPPGIIMAS